MKRNFDALRSMLIVMERHSDHTLQIMAGRDKTPDDYLCAKILCDEGLFHEVGDHAFMMTSEGYDFLDLVRDEEVWEYIKEEHRVLMGTGKTLTIDSIRDMAPSAISMVDSRRATAKFREES